MKYASFEGANVLDSAELYRADLQGTSFRDVVFKAGFKCPKYVNAGYTAKASSGTVNGCINWDEALIFDCYYSGDIDANGEPITDGSGPTGIEGPDFGGIPA